jgi:hypothetical protein
MQKKIIIHLPSVVVTAKHFNFLAEDSLVTRTKGRKFKNKIKIFFKIKNLTKRFLIISQLIT